MWYAMASNILFIFPAPWGRGYLTFATLKSRPCGRWRLIRSIIPTPVEERCWPGDMLSAPGWREGRDVETHRARECRQPSADATRSLVAVDVSQVHRQEWAREALRDFPSVEVPPSSGPTPSSSVASVSLHVALGPVRVVR
jgi:hypothetical protein